MEPPTGATKIIYLEDLMEREEDYIASNLAAKKKNQRQSKGPSSSKGKSKPRTEKKEQPKIRKQRKWGILRRT